MTARRRASPVARAPRRTSPRSSHAWRTRPPRGGYTRIRGGLQHLGHDVARNTIKAILKNHGIDPAPERGTKTPWKTFLAAHWDGLAAADFFTVEVLTWRGLIRYVVFFVMTLKTRTVEIAGITSYPDESWMIQMARWLPPPRAAPDSRPRPALFGHFRSLLRNSGVTVVRLPARSPNLNALAERHCRFGPSGVLGADSASRRSAPPNSRPSVCRPLP
jgi:putative transposase